MFSEFTWFHMHKYNILLLVFCFRHFQDFQIHFNAIGSWNGNPILLPEVSHKEVLRHSPWGCKDTAESDWTRHSNIFAVSLKILMQSWNSSATLSHSITDRIVLYSDLLRVGALNTGWCISTQASSPDITGEHRLGVICPEEAKQVSANRHTHSQKMFLESESDNSHHFAFRRMFGFSVNWLQRKGVTSFAINSHWEIFPDILVWSEGICVL